MPTFSGISLLKLILLLPFLAYLVLMGYALLNSNRLIFPVPPIGYKDSQDIIKFPYNGNGESVSMVFLRNPESRFLVFYHHGNGEDLQEILPRLQHLLNAGYSVLAWDYPGYGTSNGKPSQRLVFKIAAEIWDEIPERFGFQPENTLVYGRSLGSGPATWLARHRHPAGLILESAFTSTFRVKFGIKVLPWDIFDNLAMIPAIRCPLLLMHGTEDQTVPFAHSVQLLERAPKPKFFTWMEGGRHNDVIDSYSNTYYSSLKRFTDFISTR